MSSQLSAAASASASTAGASSEPHHDDSTRKVVPAPEIGEGWTVETRLRQSGKRAGVPSRFYYSPLTKKQFRSRVEVGRFQSILATLAGTDEEGDEDRAWKIFRQQAKSRREAIRGRESTPGKAYPKMGGAGSQKEPPPRKRTAQDQLDNDTVQEDIASEKNSSAKSAADGASRPRKKTKKAQPAAVDWCVQRIVRDLGRLDVLRRGDVGPDVVSDDEDEKALDILVRKLVAEAGENGDMAPPADDHYGGNYFGENDADDDDNIGGAMDIDDMDDRFMPAAPEHYYGEDGNSIAVVTHDDDIDDDDDGMAIMADASIAGDAEVNTDDERGSSEETAEKPSAEDTANIQGPTAAATSADVELSPSDVNYNHGARNPLNNPTSKPVYQPGDDEALGRLKGLVRRQIEWFAASSKDVADRNAAPRQKNHHIVLGQVGFRCVHCAHTPFNARAKYAVNYPGSFSPNGLKSAIDRYNNRHFMECKEIPSNIKSHSKSLLTRQGKGGKDYVKYLSIRCKSIGIIEKDGRLVYDKDSISVVDERRDVIGSDGTEEGYWLCDKCQSVKFANFDEACRHEEACRSTAGKPAFGGIDQSDAYALSLCCECNEFEEPSSDVPMLLCDRCNSATHLTCTKDVPKLTEVPDGEWYCSTCVIANKRLSEDRAITTAFTAVGAALEDNFCPTDKRRRGPAPRLGQECFFRSIPGIQSKFYLTVPSNKRVRLCVVMGCSRAARGTQRRYMCKNHFSRALLLEKIQTMPNGERRFPCKSRRQSLPQEHETAYIAVPPNAKHGAKLSCSNAVCRSLFDKKCTHKYCAVCDNVFGKHIFRDLHKHEDELGPENQKKQTQVNTSHQAADVVGAEDSEVVYGFDSIRGHTKDKKRKGEYLFRVKWKNGEITSEPDTYLREDDPDTFVEYLKRSGLSKTKKYAWANEEEDV